MGRSPEGEQHKLGAKDPEVQRYRRARKELRARPDHAPPTPRPGEPRDALEAADQYPRDPEGGGRSNWQTAWPPADHPLYQEFAERRSRAHELYRTKVMNSMQLTPEEEALFKEWRELDWLGNVLASHGHRQDDGYPADPKRREEWYRSDVEMYRRGYKLWQERQLAPRPAHPDNPYGRPNNPTP